MVKRETILLIGGTHEAVALNAALSEKKGIRLITSLAGRTSAPVKLKGEVLMGGFGGLDGFDRLLRAEEITRVIDASHPFAARITETAFTCARSAGIPYLRLCRPAWVEQPDDQWIRAGNLADAAGKIGFHKRIFLTIGRQELAAFEGATDKFLLVRSIEKGDFTPEKSEVAFLQARGPFSVDDEIALMTEHRIDLLVSKNSGGAATYAKIEAARRLKLPVLMIDRPQEPSADTYASVKELLAALT
ncbi:MAG: cobalt-precorrin-6A reductase [Alphaproteobacteria bacterium]|nr:MAG: cobalt-precorrin-6A reductase [Alphaproteobacteria bacterium]